MHVLRGERVQDVLEYVEYFESDLLSNLRRSVEKSLEEGRISFEESALLYRRYEAGLHGYTYLTRERPKNGEGSGLVQPTLAFQKSDS
jgi:arginine decarboxylase